MTKKYILLIAAISSFELASAQSLSSAPTLIFTNNTGISSDNIATDGDGGSINISDIDIQIYNISDTNGTLLTPLSWENNTFLSSNNGSYSGLTRNDGGPSIGSKGMIIKSVSGSEFKLNQFIYYNWGETSAITNTVKGYRNSIEVATTTFQGYNSGFNPITVVLSTAFDDVDEVRFYISAGGYIGNQSSTNHTINSIQVSTPVLGLNELELNSKIKIYPNPASNNITIQYKDLDNATLQVHDITGKFLINQKLDNLTTSINIEKLPAGIYFFKVNSSQGIKITKVIKH